ncbi:MAG: hypothetical protein BWY91_01733 [bacterium ADurb.BinA028]|nr:MAG: hypothetical protein BWY91_01733 [bacterium ADurb.BinA028]
MARVAWSLPSQFHIWPESRMTTGIDASTIVSLETCRLVMPLSELTIAMAGRAAYTAAMSAAIAARSVAGRPAILTSRSPMPMFGSTPSAANVSAYFAKTSA